MIQDNDNMAQEAHTYDGGVSPDQILQWKQKHGKVVRIDIVDGEDTHVGYFHRPSFETVKTVTKVAKVDEVEAGRVMCDQCWLGGSDSLRQDAVLFMAVQVQLSKVLNGCLGSIKNL